MLIGCTLTQAIFLEVQTYFWNQNLARGRFKKDIVKLSTPLKKSHGESKHSCLFTVHQYIYEKNEKATVTQLRAT